jgi:hypothetical protein
MVEVRGAEMMPMVTRPMKGPETQRQAETRWRQSLADAHRCSDAVAASPTMPEESS